MISEFDITFIDANKDGYEAYMKSILDLKFLSPTRIILCDNGELTLDHLLSSIILNFIVVFARGMTISRDANPQLLEKVRPYWTECGNALRRFKKIDPRIDSLLLPVYDESHWSNGSPRTYSNWRTEKH